MRSAQTRRTLLLLFVLSGAAGLIYQVVWFRMLSLVLGSAVQTAAAVLAAFMGGLAAGAWAIGRWSVRIRDPLRAYALLEALTGIAAWLTPAALRVVTAAYI